MSGGGADKEKVRGEVGCFDCCRLFHTCMCVSSGSGPTQTSAYQCPRLLVLAFFFLFWRTDGRILVFSQAARVFLESVLSVDRLFRNAVLQMTVERRLTPS